MTGGVAMRKPICYDIFIGDDWKRAPGAGRESGWKNETDSSD